MTDRLHQLLQEVCDETTFLIFARALLQDRLAADPVETTTDGFQARWANQSIATFIEAAVAWAEDSNFGDRPGPGPENPWMRFAFFLWAGRGYE